MKLLSTRGEVEAAVALARVLGREPIAIGGAGRGRGCGPHNTSGQGCGCTADRGPQYSRLQCRDSFSRWKVLWQTAVTAFVAVRQPNRRVFQGERITAGMLLRLLPRPGATGPHLVSVSARPRVQPSANVPVPGGVPGHGQLLTKDVRRRFAGLDVVVQREFVGMRPHLDRQDLVLALEADPRLDEVRRENASLS